MRDQLPAATAAGRAGGRANVAEAARPGHAPRLTFTAVS